MVCAKCQKKLKATELATPGVKRKNEMYYGSPSTTLGGGSGAGSAAKGKSTLGATGVGKVCSHFQLLSYSSGDGDGYGQMTDWLAGWQSKLLSSKAKNPYAAYASSCESCKTKTEQGKKFCQRCAYQKNGTSRGNILGLCSG